MRGSALRGSTLASTWTIAVSQPRICSIRDESSDAVAVSLRRNTTGSICPNTTSSLTCCRILAGDEHPRLRRIGNVKPVGHATSSTPGPLGAAHGARRAQEGRGFLAVLGGGSKASTGALSGSDYSVDVAAGGIVDERIDSVPKGVAEGTTFASGNVSALESIGKFWSGKVDGSGACV